jgi:hypothetical protein
MVFESLQFISRYLTKAGTQGQSNGKCSASASAHPSSTMAAISASGGEALTIDAKIGKINALFEAQGDSDYVGEAVSQREHALQCAALAKSAGASDPVIIGAMLHGECSGCPAPGAGCERRSA